MMHNRFKIHYKKANPADTITLPPEAVSSHPYFSRCVHYTYLFMIFAKSFFECQLKICGNAKLADSSFIVILL